MASFASLLLELALTRLFSVVLFYHFAFLAISIALLGLGAGGVFAYVKGEWLAQWGLGRLGSVICTLSAIAMVVALEVILNVPASLDVEWWNLGRLAVMYLAALIPFFFTGLLFSIVFARERKRITQLYGADLAGGALSCLAIIPLLNRLGGPNAILVAALAMVASAALWASETRQRKLVLGLAVVLLMLLVANRSGSLVDIVYAKGQRRDKPRVVFSQWNAISRIEVDEVSPNKKVIRIDSDAASDIMNADPQDPTSDWYSKRMAGSSALANVLRPHGDYAIIGPGGGVDVVRAVANGSPSVTAIEINPVIADTIMRGRYAGYSHHLYELPQVHIHVGDGRSWVRSSRDQYDVIQMTLVDTWASTAAGAFALSENNLYTVEAFREYFEHLKTDGMIAVTRWEFAEPREALRVVSQAMTALHGMNISATSRNFVIVSDGPLNERGQMATVLSKKSPFTPQEESALRAHMAFRPHLEVLYMPSDQRPNAFSKLIQSEDARLFSVSYPFNVAPVDDSSPFFFFTFKTGQALFATLERSGSARDWKNNLGVAVLGMVLVISVLAVGAFLVGPLALRSGSRAQHMMPLLYFIAIGLGYILVEIVFIQRFVLFLGHPSYAITVVVFLMLLTSGAGSVMSRRWVGETGQISGIAAAIALLVGLYLFVLPRLLTSLVGLSFGTKLLLSGALLAPLGFLMGMPFPTGLRAISDEADGHKAEDVAPTSAAIEWAWAMNAASSVLGSVLAVVIAIHFGLGAVLAGAGAAYLSAAALSLRWRVRRESA